MERKFEHCIKCATCCLTLTENGRFLIPLTKKDAEILKENVLFKKLRQQKKVAIQKGTYDPFYRFELVAAGFCPFLDLELKICKIYPDRPSNCAEFVCY